MFTPGISDGLGLERWDCQSFMVAMVPAESPVVSSFNADAVSSHIQIVISQDIYSYLAAHSCSISLTKLALSTSSRPSTIGPWTKSVTRGWKQHLQLFWAGRGPGAFNKSLFIS